MWRVRLFIYQMFGERVEFGFDVGYRIGKIVVFARSRKTA